MVNSLCRFVAPVFFVTCLVYQYAIAQDSTTKSNQDSRQEVENKSQSDEPKSKTSDIFDGKTLDGWSGEEGFWRVENGTIIGQTTEQNRIEINSFLIWQNGTLQDFELRLKFKIDGGNSGIQFRSVDLSDHHVKGYQADIDAAYNYIGILYEERGRGILAGRSKKVVIDADGTKQESGPTCEEAKLLESLKENEWSEYVITAKGSHIVQQINGFTTVDVTDHQTDKAATKGILALQLHVGPPMTVQFKDIRLTTFDQKDAKSNAPETKDSSEDSDDSGLKP